MEILSKNLNNKKVLRNDNKSYIKVKILGKTWRVKPDAESKWLKVAKVESWLRENLLDIIGGVGVFVAGYIIYCLMVLFG